MRFLRATLGLLVVALLIDPACSKGAGSVAGPDAGDAATPPDGGTPDAAAPCASDQACGASRFCEKSTGLCRDAKPCPQGQGNCDYQFDPSVPDYCAANACYCDPADQGCKPLHPPCTACARSAECGNDRLAYDYPADCAPPDAGFSDQSVCIPRRDNGCPPGYLTPASGVYCIPGGGRCGAQGACTRDDDCDPHSASPICNAQLQVCVSACTFDLKTGDSLCPVGQVCHLTPALAKLAPQDRNYGRGKCGPPCTSATACGSGLVCRSEGVDHPVSRCGLAPPQCLGDVECPDSPATGSRGYCDLAAHACRTGCRTGADCHAGFLCASGACAAETCLQAGGANQACAYGQFCCGEQDGPACPGGVDGGECYDKPARPWCATCSADADCRTSSFPNRPGEPNLCLDTGKGKLCTLGCDPGHPADCPRSWGCIAVQVGCQKTDDCGSQAGATCKLPGDGGVGTCTCSGDSDCPSGAKCQASACTVSNVCRPNCP